MLSELQYQKFAGRQVHSAEHLSRVVLEEQWQSTLTSSLLFKHPDPAARIEAGGATGPCWLDRLVGLETNVGASGKRGKSCIYV